MKYFNQECSHCEKVFKKDDDIVVCPVCGTPQHRECYEENNECINADKHAEGYEWKPKEKKWENNYYKSTHNSEKFHNSENPESIVCSNCGTENSSDSFFCKHCSAPLNNDQTTADNNSNGFNQNFNSAFSQTNTQNAIPFNVMFGNINEEDEIAPDVKLKEANKYVKTNTTFYSIIFKRIHDFNKSRFNFAAFIFSGGWFLYRKQYILGTILTILMAICLAGYAFFSVPSYQAMADFINSNSFASDMEMYQGLLNQPIEQILICCAASIFKDAQYILMIISGLIANRCYYKHVVKKVKTEKGKSGTETELYTSLDKKGGVNKLLGYFLLAGYLALSILPAILLMYV